MYDPGIWYNLVGLHLSPLEKVIRPVIVYFFLILGLRLGGKRELAQLNAFDLVVLLILSNTVQNAIIGEDNSLVGGLIGAVTLLLINYGMNRLLYTNPSVDRVLEGSRTVLVRHGAVDEAACRRELLTRAELEAAAHRQGFASLDDLEQAYLEPGGTITFVGKEPRLAEQHFRELVNRMELIQSELAHLRGRTSP